jgi:hypothetical protein
LKSTTLGFQLVLPSFYEAVLGILQFRIAIQAGLGREIFIGDANVGVSFMYHRVPPYL